MRFVVALVMALFLVGVAPAFAAGSHPENTLFLDLTSGRVVIKKLRPDLAPKHVERVKALAKRGFYDDTPSIAS